MTKRRTRKQKERANRQFTVSWGDKSSSGSEKGSVKRENKKSSTHKSRSRENKKNADSMAKDGNLRLIKHDIAKTLTIASLILGLELVIYFVLR